MSFDFLRFANIVTRFLTLASKLMLAFFLAKYLSEREVGSYGLISAAVVYAISFVGFEFHVFSSREIVTADDEYKGFVVKNNMAAYLVFYLLSLPVLFSLFYFDFLPFEYLGIFFSLVVFEHLSLEIYRLLTALSRVMAASILLFIKSAGWLFFLVPLSLISGSYNNIESVLWFWMGGGVFSFVYGVYAIRDCFVFFGDASVDWRWIRKGVNRTFLFYLSSVFIVLMISSDRFIFEHLVGVEKLAPYVIYIGISNAVVSLVEAGVFVFFYPKLVSAVVGKNIMAFCFYYEDMKKQAVRVFVLIGLFAFFGGWLFLRLLGKESYVQSIDVFFVVVVAALVKVVSMVPQYGLTAIRRDNHIALINFLSVVIYFASVFFLSDFLNEFSVSAGFIFAYFFQWKLKSYFYCREVKSVLWS